EQFAHAEVRAVVEQALAHVTEPYRTAVILRDLEDMPYDEIAEVLQISLGTVKSRITRGRDALRKKLLGYAREVGLNLRAADQSAPEPRQGSNIRTEASSGTESEVM